MYHGRQAVLTAPAMLTHQQWTFHTKDVFFDRVMSTLLPILWFFFYFVIQGSLH